MKIFYLLFAASLYVLSYSPFDFKLLIFPSLVIFFIVIDNLQLKDKIKYTFLYALLIHILGVSWLSKSLITYGLMGLSASILVTTLFILVVSIPYVIIALFHKSIHRNNFYNINIIAFIFLAAEYIKSTAFGGFPWLLIGNSQNETIFNFIYPIFGSYIVTYIVVLSAAIFYKACNIKRWQYIAPSFLLVSVYLLTLFSPIKKDYPHQDTISFSLYQPNIYPNQTYDPNEYKNIIKKYINFLDKKDSTDLTILPETITPYVLENNNKLLQKIKDLSSENNIIIAGFFTKSKTNYYNSMIFFTENIEYYHKRKLVPFGEYTPWYDEIIKLSSSIDIPLSNLSKGPDTQKDIFFHNIKLLPLVCFESTFPKLLKSNIKNEIIINISNDGWFGNSLAPYQHLQIAQVRALEFNRYILRVANTGISAVISNNGEIIEYIPINQEGVITGFVPVNIDKSFYSQYGDISILMLLFLTLLSTGLNRFRK